MLYVLLLKYQPKHLSRHIHLVIIINDTTKVTYALKFLLSYILYELIKVQPITSFMSALGSPLGVTSSSSNGYGQLWISVMTGLVCWKALS